MEITVTEAAALLGCSARTVRARVARGELPGVKRGGQWFVNRSALPLTEAQRSAFQRKAQGLRDALEEALPARMARTPGDRRRGLLDLDAFRFGAALLAELRAADPVAGLDLARATSTLEAALLDVADASCQYDRETRRAALVRARRGIGHTCALLLMGAGHPTPAPVVGWLDTLETRVLPAVVGFARWADGPPRGAR